MCRFGKGIGGRAAYTYLVLRALSPEGTRAKGRAKGTCATILKQQWSNLAMPTGVESVDLSPRGFESGDYLQPFIFFIGAIVFLAVPLTLSWLLRPRGTDKEKQVSYECGVEPTGSAWFRHPIQYYLIALVFIVFDVEAVFILPWAVRARDLVVDNQGLFAFVEMTVFAGILMLGWYYAVRKGALEWLK